MIKTTLYILLLITTAVRFVGIIILLARPATNLPAIVIGTTAFTVLFGVFLVVRRVIFTLNLKHFIQFFAVQSAIFLFNLLFTSRTVPLQIDSVERLVVGNLLDILIGVVSIYYCVKNMRRKKFVTVGNL